MLSINGERWTMYIWLCGLLGFCTTTRICNLVTVSVVITFCVFSEEWIITFWKMSPAATAKSRSVMSQCFMTRVGCACFVVYHWRNREGRNAQEANPDSLDAAVHLALCEEDFHHFSVTVARPPTFIYPCCPRFCTRKWRQALPSNMRILCTYDAGVLASTYFEISTRAYFTIWFSKRHSNLGLASSSTRDLWQTKYL